MLCFNSVTLLMPLKRGVRGDTINAMVKVEFQDRILGESTKEDCTPDAPAEFNYNTTLNVTFEDPLAIDEISCKPIVCK